MNALAPRKRAKITRSRNGCLACRQRHTKCDEERPHCRTCVRLGLQCPGYTPVFVFRDATESIGRRSATTGSQKWAACHERPNERKQQDQQLDRLEQNSSPSQTSSATDRRILKPAPIDTDILPPSTLNRQHGAIEYELGHGKSTKADTIDGNECDSAAPGDQFRGDAGAEDSTPATSVTSNSAVETSFPGLDVQDHWLSENFPTQLPPICQDIWEGVGYANLALKRALLAFDSFTGVNDIYATKSRSQCLELYTLSLRTMSENPVGPLHVTQVLITVLILTIFLHIEAKVGSFAGGLVHCRQADLLISQHIHQLAPWRTARRVLDIWLPIKSWYSLQCLPWSAMSHPLPDTMRAPILETFHSTRNSRSLIHSLLCESKNIYIRLILVRLFGPGSSCGPSHQSWSRQFEALLGAPLDREGTSVLGIEDDLLVALDRLREELNAWHDSLDVLDLPLPAATTQSRGPLQSYPSFQPAEPLLFQSQEAAMHYVRYATAQALCSREALDYATGGDLEGGSWANPWILRILQIMSGLDVELCLRDEFLHIGLEWIIYVLLFCSLRQEVLDAVTERFHWLEKIASAPGSTLPAWALRRLMRCLRREREQGHVVLFFVTDIKPTEELWAVGSASIKHSVMIMGRVARTGASFYNVENFS
ncbi:hypothetical protein F5883DRAFT_484713 [Diaporthe sp. PMI_573]|nr:hypothetical protein F5883DRAFT_484713 [Diaporthaceae sp. PMI_573]